MKKGHMLKPDPVLKDYWRNNDRFADLFNQVFFQGNPAIEPGELMDSDAEESALIMEKEKISAISKARDIIKQYKNGPELVLIGLENQMHVHYAMPVRSMLYDALRYTRQCKEMEQQHRTVKDLNGSNEFLSGITREDRLRPVVTLVLYYGEKNWDGPIRLSEMMEIPEVFQPLFNEQNIHLVQVKQAGGYGFKNPDNRDFFQLIEEFYNNGGKISLEEFKKKYADKEVYWETLAAIGAAAGSPELIRYARGQEGGRINMCTALENLKKEGIQEGIQEGMEKGIQKGVQESIQETISILKELGIPKDVIIKKILEKFSIEEAQIKEYM